MVGRLHRRTPSAVLFHPVWVNICQTLVKFPTQYADVLVCSYRHSQCAKCRTPAKAFEHEVVRPRSGPKPKASDDVVVYSKSLCRRRFEVGIRRKIANIKLGVSRIHFPRHHRVTTSPSRRISILIGSSSLSDVFVVGPLRCRGRQRFRRRTASLLCL